MTTFHHEAKAKFNVDRIVTARVGDLFVEEMGVPFEIRCQEEGQETVFDVSRRKEIILTGAENSMTPAPPTRMDTFALPTTAGGAAQPGSERSVSREVPAGTGGGGGKSNFVSLTPAPVDREVHAPRVVATKSAGGK